MVAGLFILGIILLIIGFLTDIASGTAILTSVILLVVAIVITYKKRKVSNT